MHTTDLIKYANISFKCSKCGHRQSYQIAYLSNSDKISSRKVDMVKSCRCDGCGHGVILKYHIRENKKGQLKLTVLSYAVNKKWYRNKRYQITKIPQ